MLRILIIRRFSVIVPNFTRQSNRECESVQIASGISWVEPEVIWIKVARSVVAISNPRASA